MKKTSRQRQLEVCQRVSSDLRRLAGDYQKSAEHYDKRYKDLWFEEVKDLIQQKHKGDDADQLLECLEHTMWPGSQSPESWLTELEKHL